MDHTTGARPSEPAALFESADLDEIIDWYARNARIRLAADRSPPVEARGLHVDNRQVGLVRIARSRVPSGLTLITASTEVYALTTVQSGSLHVDEAGDRWRITPGVAGFYRPVRLPRRNRVLPQTEMTYLQIRRSDLERQLETLIDQYVPGPVDFGHELPLDREPAWLRLFRVFSAVFDDVHGALQRPLVTQPLSEAMIAALLYAVDHPYRDLLHRPVAPARPRHIRVVIDAIRAEPEHHWTVASLAGLAGVSVRSLQHGFRDHVGMSPTAYLRRVRLACVHAELREGAGTTVARIAHRWGFTHLGRFAADYAAIYGVPPSVTLAAAR